MKKLLSLIFCVLVFGTTNARAAGCYVDWGQFGPSYTVLSTPQAWTSSCGSTGLVGIYGPTDFERRDQDNGWAGNFYPGDALIWNQGNFLQIRIVFDQLVTGGGAQIQADVFGDFTGTITAYDTSFNVLDSLTLNGFSSSYSDGSAIFLGLSNLSDVYILDFSVVDANGGSSVAISTLQITPVPEPETYALMLAGLGAVGFMARRRRA